MAAERHEVWLFFTQVRCAYNVLITQSVLETHSETLHEHPLSGCYLSKQNPTGKWSWHGASVPRRLRQRSFFLFSIGVHFMINAPVEENPRFPGKSGS